jgi:pimeloyl-ACP methyl ester carboxylesterase
MSNFLDKPKGYFDSWHVVFGGFRQTESNGGMIRLFRDLHNRHASNGAAVVYYNWDAKVRRIAELIQRLRSWSGKVTVQIYGYSWGGAASVNLARELRKLGISVKRLVLCDPVYRHAYWLGQWRALFHGIAIRIPDNVEYVCWTRQRESWPCGHNLRNVSEETIIEPPKVLKCVHTAMDEQQAYHELALGTAA